MCNFLSSTGQQRNHPPTVTEAIGLEYKAVGGGGDNTARLRARECLMRISFRFVFFALEHTIEHLTRVNARILCLGDMDRSDTRNMHWPLTCAASKASN